MVNFRERMIGKIAGENDGSLVFVPRMDLWYNANKVNQTLPREFAESTLFEITEALGVGYHGFVPADLGITGNDEDICHKALGFFINPALPYTVDFSGVEYAYLKGESDMTVTYQTSAGPIVTRIEQGEALRKSGSSYPMTLEPAVKDPEDYDKLTELFSHVKIIPTPAKYHAYRNTIGVRGVAVAFTTLAGSPLHHIMKELRHVDRFFLDMYDAMPKIRRLCEVIGNLYDAILDCAMATDAEVVLFGANYDDTITYPPLFEEHILPWLKKAARKAHEKGKYLLTHTDGENKNLIDLYNRCDFDIADSVCPAPMTKLGVADYRRAFDGAVTVWGFIPSIIMLKSSFSWEDFMRYIADLLSVCRPYDRLILSVADTLPPSADFDRVLYIRDQVEKVNGG